MIEINEEVKSDINKALDHLEKIIYSSENYEPKYDPKENVYNFMYKYQPDKENLDGKLSVVINILIELVTEYNLDPADNKHWREWGGVNEDHL
ncbi:hypothetical protein [Paenibacillus sp. QZ-Y1]|uniref:hypothetical protein n=1 Tax=Paenibacillus sp. QZ-Y1 TaxID=3414511 RepID=UPI003F7A984B